MAFLLGALAGGITALLFAPQSGAQTRRRLKRGADDLYEKGVHLAHDVEGKAESVIGAVKGAVSEARHAYKDEVSKLATASGKVAEREREPVTAGNTPRTGANS